MSVMKKQTKQIFQQKQPGRLPAWAMNEMAGDLDLFLTESHLLSRLDTSTWSQSIHSCWSMKACVFMLDGSSASLKRSISPAFLAVEIVIDKSCRNKYSQCLLWAIGYRIIQSIFIFIALKSEITTNSEDSKIFKRQQKIPRSFNKYQKIPRSFKRYQKVTGSF